MLEYVAIMPSICLLLSYYSNNLPAKSTHPYTRYNILPIFSMYYWFQYIDIQYIATSCLVSYVYTVHTAILLIFSKITMVISITNFIISNANTSILTTKICVIWAGNCTYACINTLYNKLLFMCNWTYVFNTDSS